MELNLKEGKEYAFWRSLDAFMASQSDLPEYAQTLIDSLEIDLSLRLKIREGFFQAHIEAKALNKQLYEFLCNASKDAEGYTQLGKGNYLEYRSSTFANVLENQLTVLLWGKVNQGYFEKSEFRLELARLIEKGTWSSVMVQNAPESELYSVIANQNYFIRAIEERLTDVSISESGVFKLAFNNEGDGKIEIDLAYYYAENDEFKPLDEYYQSGQKLLLYSEIRKFAVLCFFGSPNYIRLELWQPAYLIDGVVRAYPEHLRHSMLVPVGNSEWHEKQWESIKPLFELLLQSPTAKSESTQLLDVYIYILRNVIIDLEPTLSEHVTNTITGKLCSLLGLLDREDVHLDSNRKSTYRTYLRKSVENSLKRIG